MNVSVFFVIPLFFAACAPAQHRRPVYGATPDGVASNDPQEIADQLASVSDQLSGNQAQMDDLDDSIAHIGSTRNPSTEMRLSRILTQRGALEKRQDALLTRRTSLRMLRYSNESRDTVPLQ